jgi:hypothetical protein
MVRDWTFAHFENYGYYFDCPLDYTFVAKNTLRENYDMGFMV